MFTVSRLIPDLASANQVLETMDLPHGQSILVQIFSPLSREHVVQLARLIRSRHPQACLLGCSTEEVIFQGEVHHQVTLLQITVFEQTYLSRAVVDYSDDEAADAERLARQLELTSTSRAVVCFSWQMDTLQAARFALRDTQVRQCPSLVEPPNKLPVVAGFCSMRLVIRTPVWLLRCMAKRFMSKRVVTLSGSLLGALIGSQPWREIGSYVWMMSR